MYSMGSGLINSVRVSVENTVVGNRSPGQVQMAPQLCRQENQSCYSFVTATPLHGNHVAVIKRIQFGKILPYVGYNSEQRTVCSVFCPWCWISQRYGDTHCGCHYDVLFRSVWCPRKSSWRGWTVCYLSCKFTSRCPRSAGESQPTAVRTPFCKARFTIKLSRFISMLKVLF